ncbi:MULTISPECIES: polyprenyl synthetase family protein [Cetobacterium]|jgi:geranylgeranyl diphosphate synthase type II|uniref:Polyprenyl synthetase family protein n=1 Tax=Candidatus Cetobacterium colombiensis TaxID=3073100 RepID=A0ABU4WBQ4_9FUSO|nr:farnesyl diphosphate synthase [Candidatus Cetobacterium colombiensis]MDX8336972.1 polyprenyl synthetase family protein [Candidatus Cetobacterium colombiensis]
MLKDYLKNQRELVDSNIEYYLNKLEYPNVIADGMRYSVLNGGKRLRPILLLMVLELYGMKKEMGLPVAVAIELIHSYSLVHDDLPALDNDDYRRGKLTTHKKFGEAEAILIGDALLTHSFSLIAEETKEVSPEKLLKIIGMTSRYAGINGMIGGQTIDIESEKKKVSLDILKYIHENKTGKLIKLPIEIGAIICNSTKDEYDALVKYAEGIGLAFQIKDDILDIEGEFEKIGKPVGSDLELEKTTYPSLFGLNKSKEILKEVLEEAKKSLEIFPKEKVEIFNELADYIGIREN